jgi:hypothetical protein
MEAIFDAVTTAFPDNNPFQMHTLALALDLNQSLLHALSSIDRRHAVNTINAILARKSGYRLRSSRALQRILEQRDLDLYDQGGLLGHPQAARGSRR